MHRYGIAYSTQQFREGLGAGGRGQNPHNA